VLEGVSRADGGQVIVTTHNPQFASNNIEDLTSFARLNRIDGETTVHQILKRELDDLLAENCGEVAKWKQSGKLPEKHHKTPSDDDLTVEMESIKSSLWLNPLRCKAFFAKQVLLVEGPTETALLGWMADNSYLQGSAKGAFVMDAMGKFNAHRFMRILGALGVDHAVLYDGDDGRFADTVDATIEAEAKRNPHTMAVDRFDKEIEDFLGVQATKDKHRKPQHMMFQVKKGRVSSAKLEALDAKIEQLFVSRGGSASADVPKQTPVEAAQLGQRPAEP
jgi:predicted ATP-dependent endonuclease of OLD family